MAGDWTQMDHDLPDKPEFLAIVEATDESVEVVFFRLFCFWRVVDRQTIDGILRGCGPRGLAARCGGSAKFWTAVAEATKSEECPDGWLVFRDGDTICPAFEKRFEKCAKRRIAEAKRRREEWRAAHKQGDSSGEAAESRAESLRKKPPQPHGDSSGEAAESRAESLRKKPPQPHGDSSGEAAESQPETGTPPQRGRAPQPQPQPHPDSTHQSPERKETPAPSASSSPPAAAQAGPGKNAGGDGDNGDGEGGSGLDWEKAREIANDIVRRVKRKPPTEGKYRRLIIQAAMLSLTTFDEIWLDDAIEETERKNPDNGWAYFRTCLATGCEARNQNLDRLLAALPVPQKFARSESSGKGAA